MRKQAYRIALPSAQQPAILERMAKKTTTPPFKDTLGKRDTVKNMLLMKMTASQICLAIGCTRDDLDLHYGDLLKKHSPIEHVPTEEDRKYVWRCAAIGMTKSEIANKLGISWSTMEVHYANEIRNAKAEYTDALHNSMFNLAVNGDREASKFLLKTKCGFKETQVNELTGADGQPLTASVNVTIGAPAPKE